MQAQPKMQNRPLEAQFRQPSLKNFGPRVGFAWDLKGNGSLALRGGAGVYHDILLPLIYRNIFSNSPPYSNVLQVDNPISFPNALADLNLPGKPKLINPDGMNYDVVQPKLYHANIQLEAQLTPTLVVGRRDTELTPRELQLLREAGAIR